MDHSALPDAARDLIAAAELEAEDIFHLSQDDANRTAREGIHEGYDPSGIDYSPGSLLVELAREEYAEGREQATIHLFDATAPQYWELLKPDMEAFTNKLDAIWEWAFQKFRSKTELGDNLKRRWRACALRTRAAKGASNAEQTRDASAAESRFTSEQQRTADGGNGPTRRRAVDAYIEEVFKRTGKRITRTDIWKSARYKSRTEFERWERDDRRATKAANERFTGILKEKPHLK